MREAVARVRALGVALQVFCVVCIADRPTGARPSTANSASVLRPGSLKKTRVGRRLCCLAQLGLGPWVVVFLVGCCVFTRGGVWGPAQSAHSCAGTDVAAVTAGRGFCRVHVHVLGRMVRPANGFAWGRGESVLVCCRLASVEAVWSASKPKHAETAGAELLLLLLLLIAH